MGLFKFLVLFTLMTFFLGNLNAQEMPPPVKNDSITLAQAYINLTLTKEYFEGLSEERIGKILPFEIEELESITDPTFLRDNAGLYNFSWSLLYYNQAKFLFRTQKSTDRELLIEWNRSLEKAIEYFNISMQKSSLDQDNPFFELIKFEEGSYTALHRELYALKSLFTPYFNEDIYLDYKRIFLMAKNSDRFEIDSLAYFAGLYELEFTASIIDKKYDSSNYNFGSNTLPLVSEYNYNERDYDYHPYTDPIETAYLLDEKLDLISRYIQLKKLASKNNTDTLNWFESYRLYNDYYIFKDASLDKLFINKITKIEDPFLKTELDPKEFDVLYTGLRQNFSYASYATAQAFINLSLIQENFESLSNSHIASVLASNEVELSAVTDIAFITQNHELYHFTYSLLYENSARLLYRTRKNIDRKRLVGWKESLETGIEYYNISQKESEETEEKNLFHDLIKFHDEDVNSITKNIKNLKNQSTPYFNDDIYPDFQRIFYKAKNGNKYDFEGLKSFASIYNIRLDLSVLENKEYEVSSYKGEISQEYDMLSKLDLTSKFLQFKFLASDQFSIPSSGFDVEQLYYSYSDFLYVLEYEKDGFIIRELNTEAIEILFHELQEKFPYIFERGPTPGKYGNARDLDNDGDGIIDFFDNEPNYFFPEFAPLASASFIKRNFKPELKTLGKVDKFLTKEFISAGYKEQLHYYYASDGFALTTSLEKFNIDGSAVSADERFVKSLGGEGKLSYYEIFKSLFFEVESEFRMFALIVASNAAKMSKESMTPGFAEKLIENSYDSLPADLTNKILTNKTLSIFVYHFHQNDVGSTVELDLSGKISAQDHLKNAGLIKIIQ
ncbi:hypothetical protein C8N25_11838 [Algoriphagus antarcticus]|uniref:Uncharacterized protein n=3 Tax=Algoriphagus antarcticus TaxID=238540 RepID=A0A3E0DL20_9BACT|nr:hypothetical protein C8N25_11838 [Algoriphagus antarcticus]